jgi:hypothetical protein
MKETNKIYEIQYNFKHLHEIHGEKHD